MPTDRRLEKIRAFRSEMERELSWTFDIDEFDDRLRMQKLVYLAGKFGFDHGYSYNMYLHGPYSPELADDYYEDEFSTVLDEPRVSLAFDLISFLDLVENKTIEWLEVAATAHSLWENYHKRHGGETLDERVISATSEKKNTPHTEVCTIYRELKSRGILSV